MSKLYLGNRVADLDIGEASLPISKVILNVDSETCYQSGDDTGSTIEAECPWATQEMADSVLAGMQGFAYKPFDGADALLDPAAEIGDGITVGGMYSVLALIGRNLDRQAVATIGAPGNDEIEDEYPYKSKQRKQTDRQFAQTRSLISKTAEEITLLVEKEIAGLGDQFTELKVTLDGVTVTDANGTTLIKGSSIETDTLYVNAANINGKLVADQIDATDLVLTNSANIANNFIVDQYGNVTINGNINFSGGSITWGANDPADGCGISANEARTIISEQLVLSPNIAGGKFWNLDQDTWIEIGYDGGRYGMLLTDTAQDTGDAIFAVYNGDFGYSSFYGKLQYRFLMTEGYSETSYPNGTWDFSGATVTGLDISSTATAVFG